MNELLAVIPNAGEPEKADLWHDDFRLWITSEKEDMFPLGLL